MKKMIYILIINFSFIFCQTSSLSLYGKGEFLNNYDAASVSLGESKYFAVNSKGYSLSSISSHWKTENTFILMSLKFSNNDIDNVGDLIKNNFNSFVATFPINKTNAFSFGMNPLFRSDIQINEDEYEYIPSDMLFLLEGYPQNPLSYKSNYSFSGGPSEAFLSYSSKVDVSSNFLNKYIDNLSFGLRLSKIFGTSKYEYVLDIYNVLYNEAGIYYTPYSTNNFIYNKHRYSSSRYLVEFKTSKNDFEFAYSYGKSTPMQIELTEYFHVLGTPYSQLYKNQGSMSQNGFGFKYKINDDLYLITESHYFNSFKALEFLNIFSQENPNINSLNFGLNYLYKNPKITSRWNYLNIRIGFLDKSYKYSSFEVQDKAFTIGFGVEYLENRNTIDFGFKFGSRTSKYIHDENYFNFYLTFLTGEKWFSNEGEE